MCQTQTRHKVALTQWCKDCRKEIIQRDLTINGVSEDTGINRVYVSAILSNRMNNPELAEKIGNYLGIPYYDDVAI